jgi:hypothetical protein
MRKIIKLTVNGDWSGFANAVVYDEYAADRDGCKQCLQDHGGERSMFCVATYDPARRIWTEIGYTIVPHANQGDGPYRNALPWGRCASEAFQRFSMNEDTCHVKILGFINNINGNPLQP